MSGDLAGLLLCVAGLVVVLACEALASWRYRRDTLLARDVAGANDHPLTPVP